MSRDYRDINNDLKTDDNYLVAGYCATWQPYELMTVDGITYYEQIHPQALLEADMSDVIFQLNHEGRVYARQSNGTLNVVTDDKGIFVEVDLSSTNASKEIYDDIKAGLLNKQSWAFTVEEEHFDRETRTRHITKIKKIYDVSVVAKPANSDTSIEVVNRSCAHFIDGVIDKAKTELKERKRLEYLYLIERKEL